MPTFTINLTDAKAEALAELAADRGLASVEALLLELADEVAAEAELIRKAPAQVLEEVRRRQETPLSECRPAHEVVDEIRRELVERFAEQEAASGA